MAVFPHLVAFALAGAQPAAAEPPPAAVAAPAAAADADAIFATFESVCLSGAPIAADAATPAGFETAAWSDFPPAVRLLNTYGYEGTFFRRAEPQAWIARTRGNAHMGLGVETKCGIAARGIETAGIVERLKKRAQADKGTVIGGGAMPMILIAGRGGIFDVTRVEDGWVILRSTEILIPVDAVRRRNRKGRRD